MGKRKYFIISLSLIICAICCDFISKRCYGNSTLTLAESLSKQEDMSEADKLQAKAENDKFHKMGIFFVYKLGTCTFEPFILVYI